MLRLVNLTGMRMEGAVLPRLVLLLLLVSSLSGCLFRSRKVERTVSTTPLQTATQEQLIARMNADAAKLQTMNATVDINTTVGGAKKGKITEYKEIRGYVLARKPAMLRMIGLFPVVRNRAFDMVSDGRQFRLLIPALNKFIMGRNDVIRPSEQPLENLRPQHIYDALLLRQIEPQNEIAVLEAGTQPVVDPETHKQLEQPNYILDVVRRGDRGWFLSRKIYIDRSDLLPDRQVVYDSNGNVASDARYADFKEINGVLFPNLIEIWRPQEEYRITLRMVKLTLNQPLTDDQFTLEQPSGAQVVRLDEPHTALRASDGKDKKK
jgi:outer membrane lipoprotein-sorting protein